MTFHEDDLCIRCGDPIKTQKSDYCEECGYEKELVEIEHKLFGHNHRNGAICPCDTF